MPGTQKRRPPAGDLLAGAGYRVLTHSESAPLEYERHHAQSDQQQRQRRRLGNGGNSRIADEAIRRGRGETRLGWRARTWHIRCSVVTLRVKLPDRKRVALKGARKRRRGCKSIQTLGL